MAALVKCLDDPIIGTTREGTITAWNPAAERVFGYQRAEIIGQLMEQMLDGSVAIRVGNPKSDQRLVLEELKTNIAK